MWYRTPKGLAAVGGAAFLLGTIVGIATAGGDENDGGRPLPSTTTASTSTTTSTTSSTSVVSTRHRRPAPRRPAACPDPSPIRSPGPTLPDVTTTTLLGDP